MKTLFITFDAWRASHASFTPGGVGEETTPNLDELSENAAVFTQAVSHGPATPYAFPSIFTSTLPLDHGGYETLGEDRTLLTEPLAEAGWTCHGFHANPWLGEDYGYARGYADYNDTGEFSLPFFDRGRTFLIERFGLDHPVYRFVQQVYRKAQKPVRHVVSEGGNAASAAVDTVADMEDEEFTWVHLLAPHAPYDPPERHREAVGVPDLDDSAEALTTRAQRNPEALTDYERAAVEKLYEASVREADEQAAQLLEHVDDNTLVVVTADHGEALFEHGQVGHVPNLHDELVHVPLLVRPPGGTSRRVVDTQVRHVDIAPTILDYAGVPQPPEWRGRSLRPLVDGTGEDPDHRWAVMEVASTDAKPGTIDGDALQVGIRTPSRKVIYDSGGVHGFDLEKDPRELTPIPDPTGPEWDALRESLDHRLDELSFDHMTSAERDDDVHERLKDLGYME